MSHWLIVITILQWHSTFVAVKIFLFVFKTYLLFCVSKNNALHVRRMLWHCWKRSMCIPPKIFFEIYLKSKYIAEFVVFNEVIFTKYPQLRKLGFEKWSFTHLYCYEILRYNTKTLFYNLIFPARYVLIYHFT